MKQDRPTFHYQVGDLKVSESFAPAADGRGIVRRIALAKTPKSDLVLQIPAPEGGTVKADVGEWRDGQLTLRPEQIQQIVLHYTFP
jgi:hypothetical protein